MPGEEEGDISTARIENWSADLTNFDDNIELSYGSNYEHTTSTTELNQVQLPPVDRGRAAWLTLGICFWIEGLLWGLPFSYGVFQKYYTTHDPFQRNPSGLAAVGTTASGVIYFASTFVAIANSRWPQTRQPCTVIGLGLVAISLIAASFANKVMDLIFTQGLLYGIGGVLLYLPYLSYLDEWFDKRKGLAYGVLWAGTGLAGLIIPIVMNWGLNAYGFRTMLRAWAIFVTVTLAPLVFVTRPRMPVSNRPRTQSIDFRYLKLPTFWVLLAGNLIEGLGYFLPSIYLPSFATSLGASSTNSTLVISLLNSASIIGTILLGTLCDYFDVAKVILFSALSTTLSVLLIWGLATTQAVLYIFALAYGVFAGGFTATWTGCVRKLRRGTIHADTTIVLGIFGASRGLGSVTSGPVSELLQSPILSAAGAWKIYGTEYGPLVIFTGVTAFLGGVGWLVNFNKKERIH